MRAIFLWAILLSGLASQAWADAFQNPQGIPTQGALMECLDANRHAIPCSDPGALSSGSTSISQATPGTTNGVVVNSNFTLSTNNSTTAQLAASATFTGVLDAVINQTQISILLTSDQPGTLTVKQYIDAGGTRLTSSVPYTVTASVGFSRAITINGNYVNLAFQNTGASTTTTLNLNTYYGTIMPATQDGSVPVESSVYGTWFGAAQTLTATAALLPSSPVQSGAAVAICAAASNVATAALGPTSSVVANAPGAPTAGIPLPPGQCVNNFPINNTNLVYVITTAAGAAVNDYVYWLGN